MKKSLPLIFMVLISLGLLSWWLWQSKSERDRLDFVVENVVESFDPTKAYSDDALTIMAQVLDPPYHYHYLKRPYEVIPLVTEAMPEISADGKTYSFKFRSGLFYHSDPAFKGERRELRAEDFVMALKRIAYGPAKSPFASFFLDTLKGFKEFSQAVGDDWKLLRTTPLEGAVVDGQSVTLRLMRQEPNLIYYLALAALAPTPWEIVEYYNNDLSRVLIGTGAYEFAGLAHGTYKLKRFKNYRDDFYPTSGDRYANVQNLLKNSKGKIPFISDVRFHIVSNEEERWKLFGDKKLSILSVPRGMLPKLLGQGGAVRKDFEDKGIQVKHFPVQALRWLAINMRDPVWGKNVNLRRAIAHAIDLDSYIAIISQKTNLKAHTLLVPGLPGYDPSLSLPFHYDLKLAREFMAKAGHPSGRGLPRLKYSTRGNQEVNILEAKFLKVELAKIGINLDIEVLPFTDFLAKGRAGELQFFTDNWLFDYPDGENILQLLVSTNAPGINKAGYSNPEVDKLYQVLRVTTDLEEKIVIMSKIEKIVLEDLPWVPLMYESSYVLLAPNVRNYRKSSVARNFVKYIKLGAEEKKQ